MEPACRTKPPIRFGSTLRVASTLRPDAFSICFEDRLARPSSESSIRGRQLDVQPPLLRGHRRSNSRAISSISPIRPFSATSRRKLRRSSSASPIRSSMTCGLRLRVELRVCEARSAAPERRGRPRRSRRAPRGPAFSRPFSFAASNRARAYVRWTAAIGPSPLSSTREVEVLDRVVDQAPMVGVVEHLAGDLLRSRSASARPPRRGSAAARAASRPRSAASSPRAGAGGRPRSLPSRAGRWASATLRVSARISSACPRAWPISARCSSSSLRASSRAFSASSIERRIRSRRSSIIFWIGPNAYFFSTKSVIRKQTRVQIIRPGTTLIRSLAATRVHQIRT